MENSEQNNNKSIEIYLKVYNSIATKTTGCLPVLHMFEKLSLPYKWNNSIGKGLAIEVKAFGLYSSGDGITYLEVRDEDPIESLSAEYLANCMRKCYTFFSALNKKWRDFELEVDYITIQVNHQNLWFPPNIYDNNSNEIFFAMHSPNVLPTLMVGENFLIIQTQSRYILTYTQITTELLDSKYDTNCRDYYQDDNVTQVKMRSDISPEVDKGKGIAQIPPPKFSTDFIPLRPFPQFLTIFFRNQPFLLKISH